MNKNTSGVTSAWATLALLTATLLGGAALVTPASATDPSHQALAVGTHVETDGMLTKRAADRLARATTLRKARTHESADTSSIWLFDYLSRMLGSEPAAAKRPRRVVRTSIATATSPSPTALTGSVPARAAASLVIPAAAASPIATGSLAIDSSLKQPPTQEMQDAVIVAAERSQARIDLVKLELAARSYEERKLSGQQVFETRADWHVLERARDALSSAELTSAAAAGFEANAYINDTTKTIIVAIAGSQDMRRDFLTADVWKALIKAEAPQQFYLAKTYVRSVIQRYQAQGYSTECVGHSLGGGACAYAAAELGIRALVLNPISAGKLASPARFLVTNYIVDGELASLVYSARGNETTGHVHVINDGRDVIRLMALERYGQMAGPVLVIRELRASIDTHKVDRALDLIAAQAETARPR